MRSAALAILAAGAVSAQTSTVSFFYPYGGEESTDVSYIGASIVAVQGSHTVIAMSCLDATTTGSSLAARATSSSSDDSEDTDDSEYTDDSEDVDSELDDNGNCYIADALTLTVGSDYYKYETTISLGGDTTYDYTMAMECTRSADGGACTQSVGGKDAWADVCQMTVSDYDDLSSCYAANEGKTIPPTTTTLASSELGTIGIPVTAGADKLSAGAAASSSSGSASATGSSSAKATGSSATASRTSGSSESSASATGSAAAATGAAGRVRGGAAFAAVVGGVMAVLAF